MKRQRPQPRLFESSTLIIVQLRASARSPRPRSEQEQERPLPPSSPHPVTRHRHPSTRSCDRHLADETGGLNPSNIVSRPWSVGRIFWRLARRSMHDRVLANGTMVRCCTISIFALLATTSFAWTLSPAAIATPVIRRLRRETYDYDLVIVGAGASGLFAAGTASSIGCKTLLIERAQHQPYGGSNGTSMVEFQVGGDCTNAACVPSKAVRSVARMAAGSRKYNQAVQGAGHSRGDWLRLLRQQANDAVGKVRAREEPARIGDVPGLDLEFVQDCHFISDHEMRLKSYENSTWLEDQNISVASDNMSIREKTVSGKKFIIATGSSPVVPGTLKNAAAIAGVPYHTYRSLLRPNSLDQLIHGAAKNVVIVGGGATACELGQSISRLGGEDLSLSIVAPTILPGEDVLLQDATIKILQNDNCKLFVGSRAANIVESGGTACLVMDDNSSIPVDCVIFCAGRSPEPSLKSLHLDKAGISWTAKEGILVNSYLRSTTVRHVYACGDCASSVAPSDRRAIHAGWTGFSAVRNALLPWFLRSPAVHPFVPRVTYLDPEVASAGMSVRDCIGKYGVGGYDSLLVPEAGSDRADVESAERSTGANFIELRVEKINGRLLGVSACGPAAAETTNEVCLALVNRLTIRDISRTLHSYPSHGYLLYRISMALATKNISGLLAGCGRFGRLIGAQLRLLSKTTTLFNFEWLPWKAKALRKLFRWQAVGASKALVLESEEGKLSAVSFLDAYENETLCAQVLCNDNCGAMRSGRSEFIKWTQSKA
ncbi:hypothetical protein ACHAWF_002823 [Thalassiosira exigua]